MAIANQSELFNRIRGSIGDVCYRWHNGRQIIQRKPIPPNHQTAPALRTKNNFAYSTAVLFRGIDSTKERLKHIATTTGHRWNLDFASEIMPIGTYGNKLIGWQNGIDTHPGTIIASGTAEGNILIRWTARTQSPDDHMEFIDASFDTDGEFSGDTHITTPFNDGQITIYADSLVSLFWLSPNATLTAPSWGPITALKFNIDFNIKPTFPS